MHSVDNLHARRLGEDARQALADEGAQNGGRPAVKFRRHGSCRSCQAGGCAAAAGPTTNQNTQRHHTAVGWPQGRTTPGSKHKQHNDGGGVPRERSLPNMALLWWVGGRRGERPWCALAHNTYMQGGLEGRLE